MSNIIQLLPDHLANQIAAGEVIQRPASVVKELMENAIDADATDIRLLIKDAGKELIQVIDNGKGMSPMDARMSFERHATSKIRQIDDLFSIRTMGFRGEALASVAAVARIELKTRTSEDEAGTLLVIEGSEVKIQEPVACNTGTVISVKDLFYNVPARRKFLKSNTVEYKHIVEEFSRVAMAYPHIGFSLHHNNTAQFHLPPGNLKSRIVDLLGSRLEKQLIPLQQETELLNINGFVGKPEAATRTRGNQYIFINNRFIRNAYLNHAIVSAYEGLIDKAASPLYVLCFEIDPQRVDVNVHPTKQEVKFDDDRILYAYLQSAVKQALAKNNIVPPIDFTLDENIQQLDAIRLPQSPEQQMKAGSGYLQQSFREKGKAFFLEKSDDFKQWQTQRSALFPEMPEAPRTQQDAPPPVPESAPVFSFGEEGNTQQPVIQWREYLIGTVKSGLLLVHHRRAMERILYERFLQRIAAQQALSQKVLFPSTFQVAPQDAALFEELLPELQQTGFDIQPLGQYTFAINGVPPDLAAGDEQALLEDILEDLKHESKLQKDKYREAVLRTTVRRIPKPSVYHHEAAQALIDELFACARPEHTPSGKLVFTIFPKEKMDSFF